MGQSGRQDTRSYPCDPGDPWLPGLNTTPGQGTRPTNKTCRPHSCRPCALTRRRWLDGPGGARLAQRRRGAELACLPHVGPKREATGREAFRMYAVSASPRENPIVSAPSKFVVHPNRVPRAQPRRSWCRESSRSLARGYAFARYAAKRSRASSGQRPPGSR